MAENDIQWSRVLDRFEKVLSMVDGATTEGEAEAAAAAMARLLAKYDIDEEDVRVRLGKRFPDYERVDIGPEHNIGAQDGYRRDLMHVLAMHHGCKFFFVNKRVLGHIIGPRKTINLVLVMFDRLQPRIDAMSWQWWADKRAAMGEDMYSRFRYSQIRKLKESWRRGVVDGISASLRNATAQVEAETGSSLVLVRDARLEEAQERLIGKVKTQKDEFVPASIAYREGMTVGRGMLNKELPG